MSTVEETGVPIANLRAVQGDTFVRTISFVDSAGAAIDITGWTVFFTAKDVLAEADGSAEISETITSHTDAANGLTQISVAAASMANLKGDYFFDIQIKKASGVITTILKGKLLVEEHVTIRTS